MAGDDAITSEVWKDIPDFDGFQVSDLGRVRSFWKNSLITVGRKRSRPRIRLPEPKILNQIVTGEKYPRVSLYRRVARVHTLVLLAFNGPCPASLEACHWDGDPLNNRADNLYWGTHHQNMLDVSRHGRNRSTKLTGAQVEQLILLRGQGWTITRLSAKFAVCQASIYRRLKVRSKEGRVRRFKLSEDAIEKLIARRREGQTITQLSKEFSYSTTCVWKLLKRHGFEPLPTRFGRRVPVAYTGDV